MENRIGFNQIFATHSLLSIIHARVAQEFVSLSHFFYVIIIVGGYK